MPEKTTPEEKLLRLIENPSQDLKKEIDSRKKRFKLPVLSFKRLNEGIKQIWESKGKFKFYLFNLKNINRVLAVLSFLLTVYLIFDFIKGRPDLSQIYLRASRQADKIADANDVFEFKAANFSELIDQIDRRDIFHFAPLKNKDTVPQAKEIINSLVGNLKLVGIIWSKNPQAMIEDKKENKTWLLNQGDEIGKDAVKLKIKQILRDRVIVSYGDEEMELM